MKNAVQLPMLTVDVSVPRSGADIQFSIDGLNETEVRVQILDEVIIALLRARNERFPWPQLDLSRV
jgi:hypothetical protein